MNEGNNASSWIDILSLLIAGASLLYTFCSNIRNERRQNQLDEEQKLLREKTNRLETDSMFEKIRLKREEFENTLSEFGSLIDSSAEEDKRRLFLLSKTKYTALYNEIEAFCARIVDNVLESETYVEEIVIPELKKLAIFQAEFFGALNEKAKELTLPKVPQPDFKAFGHYEDVLRKYIKQDDKFWSKLKKSRSENKLFL